LEEFFSRYDATLATTPGLLAAHYAVRQQCFCVERQFEDGTDLDEYDARSEHALVLHRESGEALAAVRIVLPSPAATLPMGFVSRFCISKERVSKLELNRDRLLIMLGLFRAMVLMSNKHDIKYWYTIMANDLTSKVASLGLIFEPVGVVYDHRGPRQGAYSSVTAVLEGIKCVNAEHYRLITF
jgi:N-acyl-L-homoserine lactone synthetase